MKYLNSRLTAAKSMRGKPPAGRAICPHCGGMSTHILKQKDGQKLRECNSCNEHFWYGK
jgi:Zn ribbon nucleic-acid-binding protein